ncbi:cytosolic sulfotransferase 13-like [Rutidosis leptorrhynchoides]|uniref:cytosolic sulfotransferase 13-like n=1 Tax=Rutidosis leptorrhynchoides TaxID=125765 RepID=UPI003A9914C4
MSIDDTSTLSSSNKPREQDHEHENALISNLVDRYKDKLTTFPIEKGCVFGSLYMYQGFWYLSQHKLSIETLFALHETFIARPNDVYVATLPKSGTTWLKAIVFSTVNRSRYKYNCLATHPLRVSNPHKCCPFIETEFYESAPTYNDTHSPRIFGTHTPYTSLPRSIIDSGCRIIYMCRNPKDVLVSLFHFSDKVREQSGDLMKINDAFELFSKGVMPYGPYWDHVKEYNSASLERPTKVLFLTYENMKKDTANGVKRIAEFLGYPFTDEEVDQGSIEEIVKLCSFESLKEVDQKGNYHGVPNGSYFREGKVGDWTNHLTNEMCMILDQITKEKFNGLDILC